MERWVRRRRVQVMGTGSRTGISKARVERLVDHILRKEGQDRWELTIVVVGDRETKRLNREFLHHHATTDVIAFPLGDGVTTEGEVYVNIDQARRQAKHYGVSLSSEVRRLVIHGVLHLVGYSDRTESQRAIMRSLEEKYLQWKSR